uniref:SNF2-related protein n=1 Tax=Nosocomiicoccus ampullae TaxID=489910 RepID=UPI000833D3D8|nr:SNF2-related protein [Nosocomiicoccus ampullae]
MLNKLDVKSGYNTADDNLANDFFNKVLREAVEYKRVAGFFNSASLAYLSEGIEGLIRNKGKVKLIISEEISEKDYQLIKQGYENRTSIKQNLLDALDNKNMTDLNVKKNIANLAYLIEIGLVDIKVGFMTKGEGLFHDKFGIVKDNYNNSLAFQGSLNVSEAAILKNYESIFVNKDWLPSGNEPVRNLDKRFDRLWDGSGDRSFVFVKDFNDLIIKRLSEFSEGKIIVDKTVLTPDAIVFYMQGSNLRILNNLSSDNLNYNHRQFRKLRSTGYFKNDEFWHVNDNLNYRQIQDLIMLVKKASVRHSFNFEVSNSVYEFIESRIYKIEEVSKQGKLIKSKDTSLQESFKDFVNIVNKEVSRPLREAQAWVSYYMAVMKRSGNFSVPGSGKTAMLYGTYAYLSSREKNLVDKIVMIGPKNSFKSWRDEFKEVFGGKRELRVLDIHSGGFSEDMLTRNVNNYNLFLFNYESLGRYKNHLERIIDDKTMVIYDEVHKVKGVESKRGPIAIDVAQNANYRFVLTGTPIPNGYQDVHNFLKILYRDEYDEYFKYDASQLKRLDVSNVQDFNDCLYPFYWRISKAELGVPEPNRDNIYSYEASEEEQDVLDLLWKKYRHQPFVLYARLIQFSSNPKLLKRNLDKRLFTNKFEDPDKFDDDEVVFEYFDEMEDSPRFTEDELQLIDTISESTKYNKAKEKIVELVNEKKTVIVWCIFVDTMQKLASQLEQKGLKVAFVYGGIDLETRDKIITDFQNNKYDVLITNPHTLAESVSLHHVCHDAVYLEYSFNLTHMLQSRDRIHRLGLPDDAETNYYYFMLEGQKFETNTIDRKIYERLKEKEDIMMEAIEGTYVMPAHDFDERKEIEAMINEELKRKI